MKKYHIFGKIMEIAIFILMTKIKSIFKNKI